MTNRSLGWYATINRRNVSHWDIDKPVQEAVVPWITHTVHVKLVDLMRRVGTVRTLKAGEPIFEPHHPVDQLILVTKGITAREVGTIAKAIAIAPPQHFACGNLNFYTAQPCIGHYYALVPSEILCVPHSLMRQLLLKDPELAWLFAMQAELCALSDRLGFASLTSLSVEERIIAFFIAWGKNYGRLVHDEKGEAFCLMPMTIQRKYLTHVVNSSRVSLDKTFTKWHEAGQYYLENEQIRMSFDLMNPVYDWILHNEENALFQRASTFAETVRNDSVVFARHAEGFTN